MSDQEIFNTMIAFFEEDDWEFQWIEGMSLLSMGFSGSSGKWMCYAQARDEQNQFVFYSVLPINVPQDRFAAMAEFLTRANYGMIIGNFEMDYEDGEVRYKTSADLEHIELTTHILRQLVYANLIITDRYLPGIMRVIYSDQSPQEIILELEQSDSDFTDADFNREMNEIEAELDALEAEIDALPDLDDDDEFDEDDFDDDTDDFAPFDDDEPGSNGNTPH